jgi:hypothetical protein
MARSRGGSRSSADPLAGYSDEQISNALSLGVIMGEERNNLGGMALIAAGALNRSQKPGAYYGKSSILGDIFAAPHSFRDMARSILTGQSLPNVKGKSRQYSATLPKEKDAFAAVKAGLTAALRGTPVPSQWQGRYDRAKTALEIATKAKELGISLNMGAKNYGLASAPKAGFGPYAALFGEHKIGPFEKGKTPTEAELASRIAAAAAMTGVSIPRGMQAELDRYTTPAQIAATASVMQKEAQLQNPGTFPGYNYGAGSLVNKTGHAAVDVPRIDDKDLHVTPQGIAGWGQPSLSSLAGIPSAQQRSVGIPGEDPMGLPGWGVISDEAYRDYTDVLANEQLGVPDLPGQPTDLAPGSYPGITEGILNEGHVPDWSGISEGIMHGTPLGFSGAVMGSMEPSMAVYDGGPYGYGMQPDYSGISEGIMHGGALANPYGPEALGAPQTFGNYGNAPIGYSPDTFAGGPMQTQPATPDVFSGTPMGAPQGFGNYGNQDVGYPSGGFSRSPNVATDMSLAGLSPVGQGVVGVGYNPSVVAAAEPIGAPSARGMSFDQMTRGIVGYEDKPTTTTTQVANPAWSEWSKDYSRHNALQEAYLNDEMDRHGPAKPTNVPNYEWSPEPARTVSKTTTTTQRSPVYGDVPVGRPTSATLSPAVSDPSFGSPQGGSWGGPDSWGGFGSGYSDAGPARGGVIGDMGSMLSAGIADMSANPGAYGYGGGGAGGMSLGGLGGGYGGGGALGGGYGGYSGGYGGYGAATSGNEQQGGAGYGGNFGGSQGSDPSGRGGLY